MSGSQYPVISPSAPAYLEPGEDYLLKVPNFATSNAQVGFNQEGATVILTDRKTKNQYSLNLPYGSSFLIHGRIYEKIQVVNNPNLTSPATLYLYKGITQFYAEQSPIVSVEGDNFNEVVPAGTGVTTRTQYQAPGSGSMAIYLNYAISAGGDITGTAGDDWYIGLVCGRPDYNIIINRGSVVGSLRIFGGLGFSIQYYNNDTVAHRMAASFTFIQGSFE